MPHAPGAGRRARPEPTADPASTPARGDTAARGPRRRDRTPPRPPPRSPRGTATGVAGWHRPTPTPAPRRRRPATASVLPASPPRPRRSLAYRSTPARQFLRSFDAGQGQRYYLFGSTASFADLVLYYQTQLKDKGDLVFDVPPIAHVRGRQVPRGDDGVSAGCDGQGLHVGWRQGLPGADAGREPEPVSRPSSRSCPSSPRTGRARSPNAPIVGQIDRRVRGTRPTDPSRRSRRPA